MTIERRVELLGIPIKKKKVAPGFHEIFRELGYFQYEMGMERTTRYEDVFVDSSESLIHRQGYYTGVTRDGEPSPQVTTVRYVKNQINQVDLEKPRNIFGFKVRYQWKPSSSMDPYKGAALDDLVRQGYLSREQAEQIRFEESKKGKLLK